MLTLDRMALPVKAAFWWLTPESGDWLLIIGTPAVDRLGPRRVYLVIEQALRELRNPDDLQLQDVSVVSDRYPLVMLLRSALETGRGIVGIRFRNNVISGVPVEDTYIYRLAGRPGGPEVSIGSLNLRPGQEGSVDLAANNIGPPGLGAWTIDVSYDSTVVAVVSCHPKHGGVCNPAFAQDIVRVTGASTKGPVGDVILASIAFRGVKAGVSGLTPRADVLADATMGDPQDIAATVRNGSITCAQ